MKAHSSPAPRAGDHIRVFRGFYWHHGVFVGDGRVVHYSGEPARKRHAAIRLDCLGSFLQGGVAEVVTYAPRVSHAPSDVVRRARARVGEAGYNLMFNNCEHFARWCKLGERRSEQVDDAVAALGAGSGTAAGVYGGIGAVAATGAVHGMSGAGIMSGLATVGSAVGGGAIAGVAVLGLAPAAVSVGATRRMLRDDVALPDDERRARRVGRHASVGGAVAGVAGSIGAVAAAGTSGLSGVGISTGLAAIGGSMAGGIAVTAAAPAVVAGGLGYLVYRLARRR